MQGNSRSRQWYGRCIGLLAGLLSWVVAPQPAQAEGWEYGGHLKYQYTFIDYRANDVAALVGEDPANDHSFDGRLKAEWRGRGFDFVAHYEVLALAGDSVETRRALNAAGLQKSGTVNGLPDDRQRLFDLTDEFIDNSRASAANIPERAPGHSRRARGTRLQRLTRTRVSADRG